MSTRPYISPVRRGRLSTQSGRASLPIIFAETDNNLPLDAHAEFFRLPNTYPFVRVDVRYQRDSVNGDEDLERPRPATPARFAQSVRINVNLLRNRFAGSFASDGKTFRYAMVLVGFDSDGALKSGFRDIQTTA